MRGHRWLITSLVAVWQRRRHKIRHALESSDQRIPSIGCPDLRKTSRKYSVGSPGGCYRDNSNADEAFDREGKMIDEKTRRRLAAFMEGFSAFVSERRR